jgi:hypothetical protein
MMNYDIHQESINTDIFYNIIVKVISKLKEKNVIFLFDNIKFHQNKELL